MPPKEQLPDPMPRLLRRDVRVLGDALGMIISEAGGTDLFRTVEALRAATIGLRQGSRREWPAAQYIPAECR